GAVCTPPNGPGQPVPRPARLVPPTPGKCSFSWPGPSIGARGEKRSDAENKEKHYNYNTTTPTQPLVPPPAHRCFSALGPFRGGYAVGQQVRPLVPAPTFSAPQGSHVAEQASLVPKQTH